MQPREPPFCRSLVTYRQHAYTSESTSQPSFCFDSSFNERRGLRFQINNDVQRKRPDSDKALPRKSISTLPRHLFSEHIVFRLPKPSQHTFRNRFLSCLSLSSELTEIHCAMHASSPHLLPNPGIAPAESRKVIGWRCRHDLKVCH